MADRTWCSIVLGLAVCATVPCAVAEEKSSGTAGSAREILAMGTSRLHDLLLLPLNIARRNTPDWIREESHEDFDPEPTPGDDGVQVVLQQERRDGADLLTVRYPLAELGSLRAYAGAGLNQSVYYADADFGPTLLNGRSRHRSLGGAAELGAEMRFSERVNLVADVRWIDIDGEATMLKAENGLVGADPVALGLSLGWRFR